jgi:hypothetical protein
MRILTRHGCFSAIHPRTIIIVSIPSLNFPKFPINPYFKIEPSFNPNWWTFPKIDLTENYHTLTQGK